MINAIIRLSIRRRSFVIVGCACLAVLAVFAAIRTPVDAIPDLSENQVVVFTEWKGRSPSEIEDRVTYPLALGLQGMRGVRVVRSSSDPGFSMINVIFHDDIDLDRARATVAERLARASTGLPDGARPEIAADSLATGQIFWYTVEGSGYDLGRLRSIQEWYVKPRLASVEGVAEVSTVGGFPVEYQIAVDPDRLLAFRTTIKDVLDAVRRSNGTAGGHVIQKTNAEYLIRSVGLLGVSPDPGDDSFDSARAIADIERIPLPSVDEAGRPRTVADVAKVTIAPGFRRGVLEKDGSETTGGVVMMTRGENPLEVTRRIKEKIREIKPGLPGGVKIVPFYDRTPLIEGAIETLSRTVVEAIVVASICVYLVLMHIRTSFIIAITLPLSALFAFLIMYIVRMSGMIDVQMNVMSLAGIAISIGVLVDSSIVIAENAMHKLRERFGDRPVSGDTRTAVLDACLEVGRPLVFSVAIMLISFLPVLALGGIEGKMFRPMVIAKSFALVSVAALAITLVPALCTIFIKGKIRREEESAIVRSVVEVYKPILNGLLDRPGVMIWIFAATLIVGFTPLGERSIFLTVLFVSIVASALFCRGAIAAILAPASLLLVALVADQTIKPLPREFMTPLNEGMIMDMPITVPRASARRSGDDLVARDMALCRFPEVDMVVGKAGRAETSTDPAPLDMIETMVNFRPVEFWPRRKLKPSDARRQIESILKALVERRIARAPSDRRSTDAIVSEALDATLFRFDSQMREFAYQSNQQLVRESEGISPSSTNPSDPAEARLVPKWRDHIRKLDSELNDRASSVFTIISTEELLSRINIVDESTKNYLEEVRRARAAAAESANRPARPGGAHHHGGAADSTATIVPDPRLQKLRDELASRFSDTMMLWKVDRDELTGFGGELDRAVSMPGWTNVWTMPIQNRVDMLATGVASPVGVRVLGSKLEDVVRVSERIARALRDVRGAVDVVADPIRGKPYLDIRIDRVKAARLGVSAGDINEVVETALGGSTATQTVEGRERRPVVVRYDRSHRQDEESVKNILVAARDGRGDGSTRQIPLSEVANVRIVEGPATIKTENGLLRNYVRLNVRDRDVVDLVSEARRVVEKQVTLPEGVFYEFTGRYEHEIRARRSVMIATPIVIALIFILLYLTYHDAVDALILMLSVPGAIAGGVFFQWLIGSGLSTASWVGYIACLGMATSTGIIMFVYLREAVERFGGIDRIGVDELRLAVVEGAAHRLRPKLLTEAVAVVGLAPLLWAGGVGAEVVRPMAAPVLGGILVADEIIDLFLPVLFYRVRLRRVLKRRAASQAEESPEANDR